MTTPISIPRELLERTVSLLNAAKCPDDNCDGKGSTWYVSCGRSEEPEQVPARCQWCDERMEYIAAAQALLEQSDPSPAPSVHRITPECQPTFPGWLLNDGSLTVSRFPHWIHFDEKPNAFVLTRCTHWSPDAEQPPSTPPAKE